MGDGLFILKYHIRKYDRKYHFIMLVILPLSSSIVYAGIWELTTYSNSS